MDAETRPRHSVSSPGPRTARKPTAYCGLTARSDANPRAPTATRHSADCLTTNRHAALSPTAMANMELSMSSAETHQFSASVKTSAKDA